MGNIKKSTRLIMITDGFPYSENESSFISQELNYLKEKYKITIVAKYFKKQKDNIKIENIQLIECNCRMKLIKLVKYVFLTFVDKLFWRELFRILREKQYFCKRLKQMCVAIVLSKNLDEVLKVTISSIGKREKIFLYSYWYDYSLLSMVKMKRKYSNVKVITRAHGYDLYKERNPEQYQCFKIQLDCYIDKIIFISELGRKYYIENFAKNPQYKEKYIVSYLGVCEKKQKEYKGSNTFRLASCSNIISLKRIDRIIRTLAIMDEFTIEWIHIGDGIEKSKIIELANELLTSKKNLKFEFKGQLSNEDVMNYYKEHEIDCFIMFSETEGLPVSIMEALSYGIPVIATDVGGVSEIVNNENGILLTSDASDFEIARAITTIYNMEVRQRLKLREAAVATWKSKFDANINYKNFAKMLTEL